MLDFQLFRSAALTQNVLTSMPAVQGSSQILNRGNPRLVAAGMKGTNSQYGQVNSPNLPLMGINIPKNENPQVFLPGVLVAKDILDVRGFQDASAEAGEIGLLLGYDGKSGIKGGRPCGQRISVTDGVALFGTAGELANLDATKEYQILGFTVVGTTPIAVRFTHNDFKGLSPGGMAVATDVNQDARWQFPIDDLPTFKGSDPLGVEGMGAGNALIVDIQMIEVGPGGPEPSAAQGQ